jgi:glutaredoxin
MMASRKSSRSGVTPVAKQTPIEVTFYTKAGCHLCEEAREMLEEIAEQISYELTEVDIRTNMAIFEIYRYRIPVIVLNRETLIEGRIDADELARAFRQVMGK